MKKQIKPKAIAIAQKFPAGPFLPDGYVQAAQLSAVELCVLSRRGLWNLLLFLLISMAAFSVQDFNLFAAVPEDLWPLLGSPPPPSFIHLALGLYIFCALILLPHRLTKASLAQNWVHVGYRTVFYFFYLSANALAANFMVVFATGLLFYGLEQSYLLVHMCKALHRRDPQIKQS